MPLKFSDELNYIILKAKVALYIIHYTKYILRHLFSFSKQNYKNIRETYTHALRPNKRMQALCLAKHSACVAHKFK